MLPQMLMPLTPARCPQWLVNRPDRGSPPLPVLLGITPRLATCTGGIRICGFCAHEFNQSRTEIFKKSCAVADAYHVVRATMDAMCLH